VNAEVARNLPAAYWTSNISTPAATIKAHTIATAAKNPGFRKTSRSEFEVCAMRENAFYI
jgi:hypothetical protein